MYVALEAVLRGFQVPTQALKTLERERRTAMLVFFT
jgi:hypothetical protein